MKKEILLNKLKFLRIRIEDWCKINGDDSMGNYIERKNSDEKIVWKRSDWEYVDALHNTILNDDTVIYTKPTLQQLNKIWKKYKLRDDEVDKDWRGFDLNVGPDPAMNVK